MNIRVQLEGYSFFQESELIGSRVTLFFRPTFRLTLPYLLKRYQVSVTFYMSTLKCVSEARVHLRPAGCVQEEDEDKHCVRIFDGKVMTEY